MNSTPTLATRAARLVAYANGAAARRKASRALRREAEKAVGLALIAELRKSGKHVPRSRERALR